MVQSTAKTIEVKDNKTMHRLTHHLHTKVQRKNIMAPRPFWMLLVELTILSFRQVWVRDTGIRLQ